MKFEIMTIEATTYVLQEKRTTHETMSAFIDEATPAIWSLKESGAVNGSGIFTFHYTLLDEQPDSEFLLQIAMAIETPTEAAEGFSIQTIEAHQAAVAEFEGSISDIKVAWTSFDQAVLQQGHRTFSPCSEIYHHWEGPDSANNRIEFQIPIVQ